MALGDVLRAGDGDHRAAVQVQELQGPVHVLRPKRWGVGDMGGLGVWGGGGVWGAGVWRLGVGGLGFGDLGVWGFGGLGVWVWGFGDLGVWGFGGLGVWGFGGLGVWGFGGLGVWGFGGLGVCGVHSRGKSIHVLQKEAETSRGVEIIQEGNMRVFPQLFLLGPSEGDAFQGNQETTPLQKTLQLPP